MVGDGVEVVPDGDGGGKAAELAQVEVGGAGGVDEGVELGVAGGEPGGKNVEETDSKEEYGEVFTAFMFDTSI